VSLDPMILPVLFMLVTPIQPQAGGEPYRQPQVAAAYGQVGVTFGAGNSIYYSASSDGGRHFGPAVKVSEVDALALGRHRGPRLVILKDALVISAVVGGPQKGDLIAWRSTDRGRSWQRAGVVNDVPAAAREGLHTMTADAKGNLFAAWLDSRDKGKRLFGATSDDGGLKWSKNVLIYQSPDGKICECCHPSSEFDESGVVWTMWRNAFGGSRDLYITSSRDGVHYEEARKLGTGTWKLNACPMDGGGFTVEHAQVISAWRRDDTVFLADGDKTERAIGKGRDVAIGKGKRGVTVAWSQGAGLQILVPGAEKPSELTDHGAFVNLVALPDGTVLAAWETNGEIQVVRVAE